MFPPEYYKDGHGCYYECITGAAVSVNQVHGPDSTANSIIQCRKAPPTSRPDEGMYQPFMLITSVTCLHKCQL